MKIVFRGVSSAAMLIGLAGLQSAWAQQTTGPQTVTTTTDQPPAAEAGQSTGQTTQPPAANPADDKVVITGSLIATTPENSPKPVEVYTREDMREIGSPSIAEFIRDLSIASDSDIGGLESSGDGVGSTTGYAPANLRGMGDTATLTLLNGRRLSTDNGVGADINSIPSNALGAVEILRDGASTTYGAGAVGGVINLKTRRDIDAPEITVRHEAYDKSAGEWSVEAATGWVGDSGNLLVTYSFDKSPELRYNERDFSSQPFTTNPTGYTLDNGSYTLIEDALYNSQTGQAYLTNFWLPGGTAAHTDPRRRIMDLNASQCTNAGGAPIQEILPGARFSTTAGPNARLNNGCALPLSNIYSLVNEEESHKVFAEMNLDLSEDMAITVNMLYSTLNATGANAPSEQATSAATIPYGVSALVASQNSTVCSVGCGYVIPVEVQLFNASGAALTGAGSRVRNPFVDDFFSRAGLSPASFGQGDALYVGPGWRPILFGGNPLFDDGRVKDKTQRERFQIVGEVKGEFNSEGPLSFLNGIGYTYSGQYNRQQNTIKENLMLTSRLQNALLGYGGPDCLARDRVATAYNIVPATVTTANAITANQDRARFNSTIGIQSDTAPGTNGCYFFNPFNSSWQTSLITGADNSAANGGVYGGAAYENPTDLINWMYRERTYETIREALIFDTVWTGTIPYVELPGGDISWAAGLNWRQTEYRQLPSGGTVETALDQQPCGFPDPQFMALGTTRKPTGEPDQYIGAAGCTSATGAWTSTGRYLSRTSDEQVFAYYAEVQLPILDELNMSASWRREEFNNGRIKGDIWNVAGKYDITDNLFVRASYGTNFRATASLNERPGTVEFGSVLSGALWGRVGNVAPSSFNIISPGLKPEDDRNFNAGIAYQTDDLYGARFRAGVDFFEIQLLEQVVGGSAATMLTPAIDAVFRNPDGSVTVGTAQFEGALADCDAPAALFWGFNTPDKSCQPGVTGADAREFYAFTSNGGGFITNGLDYSVNWSIPAFDGRFSVDLRATNTLVYKDKGTTIAGVQLAAPASQIGLTGTLLGSNRSVDWKGTTTLRFANEENVFTVRGNYTSGQWLRGYLACQDPYFNPATNAQLSTVGGTASCGTGLTAAFLNPATGLSLDSTTDGAVQFSDYGARPKDRITWDINYIYRPEWLNGLELGAAIENIFDEDPIYSQTSSRGYVAGNPRGRIYQLELTQRF